MTNPSDPNADGPRAARGWVARYEEVSDGTPAWREEPSPALVKLYPSLLKQASQRVSEMARNVNVVDLGCGDGRNLGFVLQESAGVSEFRVEGIDVSPIALANCKALLANHDERRINLKLADIVADSIAEDQTVDLLLCLDVFGQIPVQSVGVALRSWGRSLARGGQLLLNAYTPEDDTRFHCERDGSMAGGDAFAYWYKDTYYKYYSLAEVAEQIESAGLVPLSVERMEWRDPPHGTYRPEPHNHVNWVILSTRM